MAKRRNNPNSAIMKTPCPHCGRMYDFEMVFYIHLPGDEILKKKVLDKTLFSPTCPRCGGGNKIRPLCMYLDENKRELFIVKDSRDASMEDFLKSNMEFEDVVTMEDLHEYVRGFYKRRMVLDVDSFREKILLSEQNMDDRIVELMKLSVSGMIEKNSRKPVYRIFMEDISRTEMEFVAFLGKRPPFEYTNIKTPLLNYAQFLYKYQDKLGEPEAEEYIFTDQNWAKKSGLIKNETGYLIRT